MEKGDYLYIMKRTALSEEQVAREVGAAMETPQGRSIIGQTILEPFKRGFFAIKNGLVINLSICWNILKLLVLITVKIW